MPKLVERDKDVPHVWHTVDEDGGECRHLAMCEQGAIQAHLLHFGMLGYAKTLTATDEGPIRRTNTTVDICFEPVDVLYVLYGLSFRS